MELLSAPMPGTEPVMSFGAASALVPALFLSFAALQALLWTRGKRLWLRLAPLWLSGGLAAAFLLSVVNLNHPYEAGFALFCALAALLGSLAGLAGSWLRRNK